jgi:hypothetical protein
MKHYFRAMLTAISLVFLFGGTQAAKTQEPSRFPIDVAGRCIYPRDFSRMSIENRSRVEKFWHGAKNDHLVTQEKIQDEVGAEIRSHFGDRRTGLSVEEIALRDRIIADGHTKKREDQAFYQKEYDTFISTLPAADREVAEQALAPLITLPPGPGCPKGFQIDRDSPAKP